MSLSATTSNFISRGQNISTRLLAFRAELEIELGEWSLTSMTQKLSDEDIQIVFPDKTSQQITDYVTAIKTILIAMGQNDGGGNPVHDDIASQAANLIKMMR